MTAKPLTPEEFKTMATAAFGTNWARAAAVKTGVSRWTAMRYATGEVPIPPDAVKALADAFLAHIRRDSKHLARLGYEVPADGGDLRARPPKPKIPKHAKVVLDVMMAEAVAQRREKRIHIDWTNVNKLRDASDLGFDHCEKPSTWWIEGAQWLHDNGYTVGLFLPWVDPRFPGWKGAGPNFPWKEVDAQAPPLTAEDRAAARAKLLAEDAATSGSTPPATPSKA